MYILGDLFEVWLGDDDDSRAFDVPLQALEKLSNKIPMRFIHGNRDFLVGDSFASRFGMEILDEPHIIELDGQRIALMHGDLLCTDDVDYQNFRKLVRSAKWQNEFLSKSLQERQSIAAGLRQKSAAAMSDKKEAIMDVNDNTVEQYFNNLKVDTIIHGHTHRPAIHDQGNGKKRYVLGDWNPAASFLVWRNGVFQLSDNRVDQ